MSDQAFWIIATVAGSTALIALVVTVVCGIAMDWGRPRG